MLHMRHTFSIANETYSIPVRTDVTDIEAVFSSQIYMLDCSFLDTSFGSWPITSGNVRPSCD